MAVFTYLFVVLATLASLALPILGVVLLVTWVRRGRHLEGGETGDSLGAAVLDSLDQVHVRLDAVSDRLTRLEQSLEARDRPSLAAPKADDAAPEGGDAAPEGDAAAPERPADDQ